VFEELTWTGPQNLVWLLRLLK